MKLGGSYRYLSQYLPKCSGINIARRDHVPSARSDTVQSDRRHSCHPVSHSFVQRSIDRTRALPQSALVHAVKGRSVHLPIDYIQLLGLHLDDNVLESQVLSAFARFSAAKIEDGYSARAMAGRQQLLEEAKEEALKIVNKKTDLTNSRGIDLASHLIPGALSLLVQVAQYDLVVQVGSRMLESSEAGNMKGDILLAMSLAKLGQADNSFTIPNQVALACTQMEEALQFLKRTGATPVAPVLYKEIEDALETYVPRCVLEQLKLPLTEENSIGRKGAINILQGLLAVPRNRESTFIGVDRHYVKQVMDCLTTTEVLNSVDWATVLVDPKSVIWYYPGLLLRGAAVHIVVGFLERRPALLRNLDSILNLPGKDREAHVEHIICRVLLGEVEEAFEILEKTEGSGNRRKNIKDDEEFVRMPQKLDQNAVGAKLLPGRNETFAFVKANSQDDDFIPGLHLFVERWLHHAGFSQFRDLSSRPPSVSLTDYFSDRRIENFSSSKPGAHKRLFDMIIPNKAENRKTEAPTLKESSDAEDTAHDAEFLPAPDLETNYYESENHYLSGNNDMTRQLHSKNPNWKQLISMHSARLGVVVGGVLLCTAVFVLRRNPWIRYESQKLNKAVLSAEVLTKSKPDSGFEVKLKPKASKPQRRNVKKTLNSMQKKDAEVLIRKWQFAKAEALGPTHQFQYMKKVLTDPMLEKWTHDIQQVQQQGRFWIYKLEKCKVNKLETSNCFGQDGYLEVSATIKEKATMYSSSGRPLDQHTSQYNVIYQVISEKKGRPKIRNVEVLRP